MPKTRGICAFNILAKRFLHKSLTLSILILFLGCEPAAFEVPDTSSNAYEATLPEALWEEFEQIKNEKAQIEYLLAKVRQSHAVRPAMALTLAEHVELLSQKQKDDLGLAEALFWKAYILNEEDPLNIDLQRALVDVRISSDLLRGMGGQERMLARAHNLHASLLYNLYQSEQAEEYNRGAQNALSDLDQPKDSLCLEWGDFYRIRANILYDLEMPDSVAYYYDQALAAYQHCGDAKRQARLLWNYAIFYQDSFERADALMHEAITLLQEGGHQAALRKAKLDHASMLAWRFYDEEEIRWYESSMGLLRELLSDSSSEQSEVYYEMGANHHNYAVVFPEEAEAHYDSLAQYYLLAIEYGVREQNPKYVQQVGESVAKICEDIQGRCSSILTSSAAANNEIRLITRTSFREAGDKREAFKVRVAQDRLYRNRLVLISLLAFVVGGLVYLIQRSKVKHEKAEKQLLKEKLESKMAALRAQMNPHFISNSLNAIDSLVNKGDSEQASEYIIDFSRLSRLVLNNSKEKRVSLAKELDTLRYYLRMEKLRMRDNLNYHFEIDENLNIDSIEIAPMVLQPFIENAIIHGIQNKQAPGNIWLQIHETDQKQLEIRIKDDGVGREKAKTIKRQSVVDRTSWGMEITAERLMSIQDEQGANIRYLDLYDEFGEACGTEVVIHYPIVHRSNQ